MSGAGSFGSEGDSLYKKLIAEGFDPAFYLKSYPDVAAAEIDPLEHFVNFGYYERRYKNTETLNRDYEIVSASGQFDHSFYRQFNGSFSNDIQHYLIHSGQADLLPRKDFDPAFFIEYYRDTITENESAFAFYCAHLHEDWCWPNLSRLKAAAEAIQHSELFDALYVRGQMRPDDQRDEAAFYVAEGARAMVDPSPDFNSRAYLEQYPDIALARLNPLIHYTAHGHSEGRHRFGDSTMRVTRGKLQRRAELPTLVIFSHEASRTGAPLVGLNLMRELCGRFNIVAATMRGGILAPLFSEFSIATVLTGGQPGDIEAAASRILREFSPQCVILNSMETTKFAGAFSRAGVGVISLIHEFAQYVRPVGSTALAICLSDKVIFPAQLVCDSALDELRRLGFDAPPNNIRIRSQGRSIVPLVEEHKQEPVDIERLVGPAKKGVRPFVVLGAGWVQMRKGVDHFIEAARILKHELGVDCRFIWVGGNYAPQTDMVLSVYLADQITKSNLDDVVVMVEEQASLAPFWRAADAFFMSSRLDPFPNVALDAISEGLPVVVMKGGTGIADLADKWPEHVKAVGYGDMTAAAQELAQVAKAPRVRLRLPEDLQSRLSFSSYADELAEEVIDVMASGEERQAQVEALCGHGLIDAELFARTAPQWSHVKGIGVGANLSDVASTVVRSVRAGVPLGLLRDDRAALLAGPDWDAPSHKVVEVGRADTVRTVLVATDDPDVVVELGRRAYVHVGKLRVFVISRTLEEADLGALQSVLPADCVGFGKVGGSAEPAAVAAAWLNDDPFECIRAGAAPSVFQGLDAEAAFGNDPDLSLVLQASAAPLDVERVVSRRDRAVNGPSRALVDPAVCWLRTSSPQLREAFVAQLVTSLDSHAAQNDWITILEQCEGDVSGKWAFARSPRWPRLGCKVLYGS